MTNKADADPPGARQKLKPVQLSARDGMSIVPQNVFAEMQRVPIGVFRPLITGVCLKARPEMARQLCAEFGSETFDLLKPLPQQDIRLGVEFGWRQRDEGSAIFGAQIQFVGGAEGVGAKRVTPRAIAKKPGQCGGEINGVQTIA